MSQKIEPGKEIDISPGIKLIDSSPNNPQIISSLHRINWLSSKDQSQPNFLIKNKKNREGEEGNQ